MVTFATMKAGPFYILFIFFAFLFVFSKGTNSGSKNGMAFSSQSCTITISECAILPYSYNSSLDKAVIYSNLIPHFKQWLFEYSTCKRVDHSANKIRFYLLKSVYLKPQKEQPPLIFLFYSNQKNADDHYFLG